ncbi:NAD(P)H-hydrate dehydratase [Thalassococcus sp. BH17M4-6]|uniref:NAD(P)H-hydrate dehydratase n=1 Tax=Thalassococcus sp. BH17M4-6 TaxID=3413148 RepID=UPI003BEA7871
MTELLTAAQMRALEQAAIASGAVTGLELMERAGRGVVAAVFAEWPELAKTSHRAVVLCGPGNNGGDGFVIARLLKGWGWQVEAFLYGDPDNLPPDARVNYERWAAMGPVLPLTDAAIERVDDETPDIALVVDAVFGTGLNRGFLDLPGVQMAVNGWQVPTCPVKVVAVDCPSGLCADSGRYLGLNGENPFDSSIMANLTVTFHAPKRGHVLGDGPSGCGKLAVKDIGIAASGGGDVETCRSSPRPDPRRLVKHWGHKFGHGHALILSGGAGRTGAARLAAKGALRIGAGLVTLGVPPAAQMEVACQITALMLRRVADAEALATVLQDQRLNAVCLGPGLGLERARELVPVVLGGDGVKRRPTVLDADALSAFGDVPDALFRWLHNTCVLTPHAGEFARLFPDIAARLNAPATKGPAYSKVDATREAAARAGCVVLFKGPDTVIADPKGRCAVHAAAYGRAAPWLATAGSGDVLAGFITGLLARGIAPMQAAQMAAWLHVDCALSFGPGLIAEDLPEELPMVLRRAMAAPQGQAPAG